MDKACRTTGMSCLSESSTEPPKEVRTRPLGSATRKMASWRESFVQISEAVSRMVASSPVLKAARTSDIWLSARLTDSRISARDLQKES